MNTFSKGKKHGKTKAVGDSSSGRQDRAHRDTTQPSRGEDPGAQRRRGSQESGATPSQDGRSHGKSSGTQGRVCLVLMTSPENEL